MKTLFLILFFTGVFMGFFFLMSSIALLWCDTYAEIIKNPNWFMMYTLFFGWWLAMIPTIEMSNKYDIDL